VVVDKWRKRTEANPLTRVYWDSGAK